MNTPLLVFLGMVSVFFLAMVYFFHEVLRNLPQIIAEHARVYSRAYAKATCLILLSTGTAFKETFSGLTAAQAAAMTWWEWASLFWMPIAAGLGVVLAFLDTSVAVAKDQKSYDKATGTVPPFSPQPPKTAAP